MSGASFKSDLPKGKKYHCNFIYNCAKRKHLETKDTELSLKFVEFLEQRLKCWGYTKCYYYDEHARPGADVFDELFETMESSMWTFVIITEDFSKNLWVKYCQRAVFKTLIDKNAGDNPTLIPIVLGGAQYPPELHVKGVLSFRANEDTWQLHARELRRLKKLLEAAPLCVPVSQTTNAEVTQGIYSTDQSQPVTDTNSSNNNSQNDQLETDSHAEDHNIVKSERQMATVSGRHLPQTGSFEAFSEHNQFDDRQNCETGSRSPSSSNVTVNSMQSNASHYESLSNDPDLSCDHLPLTMKEVQTNAANYEPTAQEQAAQEQAGQNVNPNTLELRGKSLSIESLVNSQSNEPNESTSPEQSLSALDPGFVSGGGMTLAHDISTSQKTLQREENKSDIRVGNSMTDDLERNNASRTDTRDNQMVRLRLTGMEETQPENSINANNQERVDPVRGERPRPDGCEIDEAASDSADLKPTSHPSRWNSTIVAGGSYVLKSLINGVNRTDSFPF